MGSHCPFGHLKHKLLPKEGSGVKLAIWLPTTKSWENRLNFHACRWHATYCWKALEEGYKFALDLILIEGFHAKLWCPKVAGVPTLTKCHLDMSLMGNHGVYYKGEGGAFPQIWVVVNLVNPSLPVVRSSTKSAPTMY
jgi:hypothetical protein